jgi:ATP-dependent Zn protease
MLCEAENVSADILSKNRHILDPLAQELLKEEVLDKNKIDRIIAKAGGQAVQKHLIA